MTTKADETKLNPRADRTDVLIKNAHEVLDRMDTRLTLAEAKTALVHELIARTKAIIK